LDLDSRDKTLMWQAALFRYRIAQTACTKLLFGAALLTVLGCGSEPQPEAEAQQSGRQGQQGPAAVDVVVAKRGALSNSLEYTGTTQPYRSISLRTQAEGQLSSLAVDVGDPVARGQVLARLDNRILSTAVGEAQAEAAALESNVAQASTEVSEGKSQVTSARLELEQAQADLNRLEKLFAAGAISKQQVEQARTEASTRQQAVAAAQQVVQTRQQAVTAAQRRVVAQQSVIAREKQRLAFAVVTSPVNGVVLERIVEPGNLAQVGSEILKLGDFSRVKVSVQVSELELTNIRSGQSVQVKLDAFPKNLLQGEVSRVSPVADPTARLIPVEVTIPNSQRRIGSGLLARVNFGAQRSNVVVVPEGALQTNRDRRAKGGTNRPNGAAPELSKTGTLFTIAAGGPQTKVVARRVTIGQRQDGQVEVLSGISPGDRLVTRSSKALKDGDPVRLSAISEGAQNTLSGRSQADKPSRSRNNAQQPPQ
jgi:HlyD family secretion protein